MLKKLCLLQIEVIRSTDHSRHSADDSVYSVFGPVLTEPTEIEVLPQYNVVISLAVRMLTVYVIVCNSSFQQQLSR